MKKILIGLALTLALVGCSGIGIGIGTGIGSNVGVGIGTEFDLTKDKEVFIGKEYVLQGEYKEHNITINFGENDFFGFAGVNRYFGGYVAKGNTLTFSNVGMTKMMGPQDKMTAEDEFINNLNQVDAYTLTKDTLVLKTSGGKTLEFKSK